MKDVKATIVRRIAEYLDKEESEIKTTDTFTEIGLDSLDIMELVMQMQEDNTVFYRSAQMMLNLEWKAKC